MTEKPIITALELTEFEYTLQDIGTDYNGFNLVYEPGSTFTLKSVVLQIHTNIGITGEHVTTSAQLSTLPMFAHYLIGKNALER
ncbi:MAG: mandelate racemase, partial [Anaerolineae bacterium]|nr:mandelate racemase [Anaerolineae bacterium]